MAPMTAQTNRFDPYRTFRFKVRWDNQYVAGLSRWERSNEPPRSGNFEKRARHRSPQLPGKSSFADVNLRAGITYDTSFEGWADLVNDFASHRITSLGEFLTTSPSTCSMKPERKRFPTVYRCWVSEYQALPELDAGANAVAITTVKLAFEWFERDNSVTESQGPARIG